MARELLPDHFFLYRTAFRWWPAGPMPGDPAAAGPLLAQAPKASRVAPQRGVLSLRGAEAQPRPPLGSLLPSPGCAPPWKIRPP